MTDLMPEPPDGALVLIGVVPVRIAWVRDDAAAAADGEPQRRWWRADGQDADDEGHTWQELCLSVASMFPPQTIERLFTQAELDQAVADGGYEQVGEHRVALGAGRCVIHGEFYTPVELDRLRQRAAEEDHRGD